MAASRGWTLGAALVCALSAACASSAAKGPALPNGGGGHKSYVLPLVEIVAMDAAVNLGGRLLVDRASFTVTPASIRRNLRGPWVVDEDPFQINQFGHPYQGAMYHDIARSNGLGYWPVGGLYVCCAARCGRSPAKPPRHPVTIRSRAASPARSSASRCFASRASSWNAPTRDPGCGEDWRRCSRLRRPASITSWSALRPDRSRRMRCRSPTSASSSAPPRWQPAGPDQRSRWHRTSRNLRCRWTTGIRETPATGMSVRSTTSGSTAASRPKDSNGCRRGV